MKIDFKQYKAALFDFDGIFVDSEKVFFQCLQKVLKEKLNIDAPEEEYYYFWSMRGIGMKTYLQKREIKLNDEKIQELESLRKNYYLNSCKNGEICFIDGMIKTVAQVRNQGLKVAIASNTPKDIIEIIFDRANLKPPCDVIGKHPGLRGKPEPDIFVYSSGFLQVNPADCIVIEDALKGIIAAHKVQMSSVLIRSRYWDDGHEHKPDFIFQNHNDFIDYLGS